MSMRIGSECSLATRILATRYSLLANSLLAYSLLATRILATRYSLLAVFIHLGMRPAYGELLFDNLKPAERP